MSERDRKTETDRQQTERLALLVEDIYKLRISLLLVHTLKSIKWIMT